MKTAWLLGLTLTIPTIALADCYTLVDQNNQIIYSESKPPFDISTPPDSPALIASKQRGERLSITYQSCNKVPKKELVERNTDVAAELAKSHSALITTKMRQYQEEAEYEQRQRDTLNAARHELQRSFEQDVRDLKFQNDLRD